MVRRLLLILILWFCTELYFYQAIRTVFEDQGYLWLYWLIDLVLLGSIISTSAARRGSQLQQTMVTWMVGLLLLAFIPRFLALPILLVEDITRLFVGFPARRIWVSELALTIAAVLFPVVLFGITRGRHFYRLRRETIWFPDLPEAFDGFTITQISDVHSGSFTNAAGVQKV
jgi:hypothetical protein